MARNCVYFVAIIFLLSSCAANRALQTETILFPGEKMDKWWIINSISNDTAGNDLHFSSLVSMDEVSGKKYATCFVSMWSSADSGFYTGIRNTGNPAIKQQYTFPVKIDLPGNDTAAIEWRWLLKRKVLELQTELKKNGSAALPQFTTAAFNFNTRNPFSLSKLSAEPDVWAAAPIASAFNINGVVKAAAPGKLFVRVFTDKNMLLNSSASQFVHWLDLGLRGGKQLSILFTTDNTMHMKPTGILLWDEKGNIMAKPAVQLYADIADQQPAGLSRQYPLFFSIALAGENIDVMIKPTITLQEIGANRNSFWMGAVYAVDKKTKEITGKGNMYIFKK